MSTVLYIEAKMFIATINPVPPAAMTSIVKINRPLRRKVLRNESRNGRGRNLSILMNVSLVLPPYFS